jgi:hypothetical protein
MCVAFHLSRSTDLIIPLLQSKYLVETMAREHASYLVKNL